MNLSPFYLRVAAILAAVILTATATGQVASAKAEARPDPASSESGEANYVLSANDLVKLSVFQEADLETTVRISKDGTVTFPLVGAVKIGGRTSQDAARLVRDLLAKDYLVNPQVNLTVMEYSKRRFIVLGQVQRPGAYDMPDRDAVGLLQAIGMAGGYTRIADPGKITLKRGAAGKEKIFKLNAKKMANADGSSEFTIEAGDIITVGESIF